MSGYYWQWIHPIQSYVLKWKSIENTYSPPYLDNSLEWYHFNISFENYKKMSINDKNIVYMYYRFDLGKLEIWTKDLGRSLIHLQSKKK